MGWRFKTSTDFVNRARRANSFDFQASRQTGWMAVLENFPTRFIKEKASRSGLPNKISAGDNLQSASGVFLI